MIAVMAFSAVMFFAAAVIGAQLARDDFAAGDYRWAAFSSALAAAALSVSVAIVIGAINTAGVN